MTDIYKYFPEVESRGCYLRELGCSDCSKPFGNAPFVHHETDGGFGGPYCMRCAVALGFGKPGPHQKFVFHDSGED